MVSGEPVVLITRSRDRSATFPGSTPAFIDAPMSAAPQPKWSARVSPTSRQISPASGYAGLPSNITMVQPPRSPLTSSVHTIHPVLDTQKNVSPARMSLCSRSVLRCSMTIPPCPCTIAFGTPVVPDE